MSGAARAASASEDGDGSRGGDFLDVVVCVLGDVEIAGAVDGEAYGAVEAVAMDGLDFGAVGHYFNDGAVVAAVCDVEISGGVDCHSGGFAEDDGGGITAAEEVIRSIGSHVLGGADGWSEGGGGCAECELEIRVVASLGDSELVYLPVASPRGAVQLVGKIEELIGLVEGDGLEVVLAIGKIVEDESGEVAGGVHLADLEVSGVEDVDIALGIECDGVRGTQRDGAAGAVAAGAGSGKGCDRGSHLGGRGGGSGDEGEGKECCGAGGPSLYATLPMRAVERGMVWHGCCCPLQEGDRLPGREMEQVEPNSRRRAGALRLCWPLFSAGVACCRMRMEEMLQQGLGYVTLNPGVARAVAMDDRRRTCRRAGDFTACVYAIILMESTPAAQRRI